MCVLMDTELRGFSISLTKSSLPSPIFSTRGEMSDMELYRRFSAIRLVKPATAEMSDIELLLSHSCVS